MIGNNQKEAKESGNVLLKPFNVLAPDYKYGEKKSSKIDVARMESSVSEEDDDEEGDEEEEEEEGEDELAQSSSSSGDSILTKNKREVQNSETVSSPTERDKDGSRLSGQEDCNSKIDTLEENIKETEPAGRKLDG